LIKKIITEPKPVTIIDQPKYTESTLTDEIMDKEIQSISDDDLDFLGEIDDDDADFPIDELLENPMMDEEKETHLDPQYYSTDYLNIGGYDVILDDIFVKRPTQEKSQRKKKEGVGYMYTRLMSTAPLLIIQQQFEYNITTIPQYISVGAFIDQLNYYNDLLKATTDIDTKIEIAFGFHTLFTNTFITESTNKHNVKYSYFQDRQIIFCNEK